MKRFLSMLLAGTALVAAHSAANATLTVQVYDNLVPVTMTPSTSGTGALVSTGSDSAFSSIIVSSVGVPLLNAPDLGTTTESITVHKNSQFINDDHDLDIVVTQTGFNFDGGMTQTTFTYNALIGMPGPAVETQYYNSVGIATHTFAIGDVSSFGPVNALVGAGTNDAQGFSVDFAGPNMDFEGTIEFASYVPEPTSLALLGSALFGLGFFGRRRRQ